MTVKTDDVLSHAEFIEKTVESHRVRLVVVNGFEFAAMMPRRRMRLLGFLLNLRDFSGVDIAIGTRRKPSEDDSGSYGALAFQAAAITPLAEATAFPHTPNGDLESKEDEWSETRTSILHPYDVQAATLKTKDLEATSDTPPKREYAMAA